MKRKLISAITATVLIATTAEANIDTFLNDAVVEVNGAKTLKTDSGTVLYGGGIQMRAKNVSISPISITTPKVSAGCGGIDATLGSLSYLDVDQIVNLLEGMMANAPGVMFEMALKVICPSCMDTLNALNEMANQINSINVDSCGLTKAAGNWAEPYLKEAVGNASENDFNKALQNFNKGVRTTAQDISSIKNRLSAQGCNPTDKTCGAKFFLDSTVSTNSFLKYAMMDDMTDTYFSNNNFVNVIRYFGGDIKVTRPTGEGENKRSGTIKILGSITGNDNDSGMGDSVSGYLDVQSDTNTKNILKYLIGDTSSTSEAPKVRDENGNLVDMSATSTNIKAHFETKLSSISTKLSTRTALTSDDINFLSMFRMPVYLITNKLASIPNGGVLLEKLRAPLAEMLAYEITYEYLSRTAKIATLQREKLDRESIDSINYQCSVDGCYSDIVVGLNTMQKGTQQAAMLAYQLTAVASAKFSAQLSKQSKYFNEINAVQQFTIQRSNPRMFSSYMFSKTLATDAAN